MKGKMALTRSSITDRMWSEMALEPELDGSSENTWYTGTSDVTKSLVYEIFLEYPTAEKPRGCTLLS
jgi:hypothetical protein